MRNGFSYFKVLMIRSYFPLPAKRERLIDWSINVNLMRIGLC